MELKINTNIKAGNKANNKLSTKSSSSFSKTLDISKNLLSAKDPLGNLSKKGLETIKRLEDIFGVKITNDDFKSDGYLDIMPIIRKNSENIKPRDEKAIRDTLLSAVQSNVISMKDYYAAIQWLDMRAKQRVLQGKSEEEMLKVIDNSEINNDTSYPGKFHNAIFSSNL